MNGDEKSITHRSYSSTSGGEETEIEESADRSYLPPLTSAVEPRCLLGQKSKPRDSFQELTCVSAAHTCVGSCECVPDGGAYW